MPLFKSLIINFKHNYYMANKSCYMCEFRDSLK